MAERFALDLRLGLAAADRWTDRAIAFGLVEVKTPFFKSIALLVRVTRADHFFFSAAMA